MSDAAADRHLNEVVAQGGDGHRDADPGQEERVDAPVQALARHDQQHRPVPEVDAVGDAAPLGQRRQLQEAHHERARRRHAAETTAPAARLATRKPPLKAKVVVSDVVHHNAAVPGGAEDAEHAGRRAEPPALRRPRATGSAR